jgi:hypothetical protein
MAKCIHTVIRNHKEEKCGKEATKTFLDMPLCEDCYKAFVNLTDVVLGFQMSRPL